VDILQNKHSSSVTLSSSQFDVIKNDLPHQRREKKPLPKATIIQEEIIEPEQDELELEALALELELELLEF
jgi:hypothetical protein